MATSPEVGSLHHVELRVSDLAQTLPAWEWLLTTLGYVAFQRWQEGASWRLGDTYVVIEQAPELEAHDRRKPGLSHLAFHGGDRDRVEQLWREAPGHGWSQLYSDRHPWAGGLPHASGPGHYAAFLENGERFKVELVAAPSPIDMHSTE